MSPAVKTMDTIRKVQNFVKPLLDGLLFDITNLLLPSPQLDQHILRKYQPT